jgi:regulatory protein
LEKSTKILIQSCLRYNAVRMHSKQEIFYYLERKGVGSAKTEEVIEYLETNGIIDDREFASQWTESRLRRGKGDIIIQAELRFKGVDPDITKSVISEVPSQKWREAAAKSAQKQAKKWQELSGYQQKSAIYQVLRQRGFSGKHIDDFIKSRVE